MADTRLDVLLDAHLSDVLAVDGDCSRLDGREARNAVDELGLSVAVDARYADDFTGADFEGQVLDAERPAGILHRKRIYLEEYLAGIGGALVDFEFYGSANHHFGHLLLAHVGDVYRPDVFATPQHGASLGDCLDFLQLVRDEDDRFSF